MPAERFGELMSLINLSLAAAIFALVAFLKLAFPTWAKSAFGQRVTPVLPLFLGVVMALLGFCDPGATRWQDKVIIGLLSAGFAASVFKVGNTTVLGKGIEAPADGSTPPATPTPEPAVKE